jgi:hypothetical protein
VSAFYDVRARFVGQLEVKGRTEREALGRDCVRLNNLEGTTARRLVDCEEEDDLLGAAAGIEKVVPHAVRVRRGEF